MITFPQLMAELANSAYEAHLKKVEKHYNKLKAYGHTVTSPMENHNKYSWVHAIDYKPLHGVVWTTREVRTRKPNSFSQASLRASLKGRT